MTVLVVDDALEISAGTPVQIIYLPIDPSTFVFARERPGWGLIIGGFVFLLAALLFAQMAPNAPFKRIGRPGTNHSPPADLGRFESWRFNRDRPNPVTGRLILTA
jgi:hypothetical protein